MASRVHGSSTVQCISHRTHLAALSCKWPRSTSHAGSEDLLNSAKSRFTFARLMWSIPIHGSVKDANAPKSPKGSMILYVFFRIRIAGTACGCCAMQVSAAKVHACRNLSAFGP